MSQQPRVRRIALTGGIATGKSHVRARLSQLGVPTIDSDIVAREIVAPGTAGFDAVVRRFGHAVVAPDGSLDRRALGAIVFADPAARRELEQIVHPGVRRAIDEWFASLNPAEHAFGVADIPLLFETGREGEFDAVILTVAAPAAQLERVMHRDRLSEEEARRRIGSQLPMSEKISRATYVIDTNGPVEETNQQVEDVYRKLLDPSDSRQL